MTEQTTFQKAYALKRFGHRIFTFRNILTSSICHSGEENENTKCDISKSVLLLWQFMILTHDFVETRNCFAKLDREVFSGVLVLPNRERCSIFS